RSCSHQTSSEVQAKVLRLRHELVDAGHDAGPDTIAHHLIGQVERLPSVATVWRILKRNGLITPQPHKRPRSSFIRFEAKLPNETWQMDATPWQLADASPVEILNFLDDNSRVLINSTSFLTVKAADVVHAFYSASTRFGLPASASAGPRSLPPARSPFATWAGSVTSRWGPHPGTAGFACSSPVLTSASSATTANSSAL